MQAIIHDPPILILDEPTSGLDPGQIIEIRDLIRELGKRKTVILSTHVLQEAELICSRVLILNKGRIAAQGTPDEITKTLRRKAASESGIGWELFLKGAALKEIKKHLELLELPSSSSLHDVTAEEHESGDIRLCFTIRENSMAENELTADDTVDHGELIFNWAISQGYKITGMNRKKLSLEDIFVKLINEPHMNEPPVGKLPVDVLHKNEGEG